MMPATFVPPLLVSPHDPRESFLALLPAVQAHARSAFRSLRSAHDREDAVAEVVARVWEQFTVSPAEHATSAETLAAPAVAAVRAELLHAHR